MGRVKSCAISPPLHRAFVLISLLLITISSPVTSSDTIEFGELIVNDDATARKWVQASKEFDKLIFPHKWLLIKTLDGISTNKSQIGLSDDCASSLNSIEKGLRDNKMWAYQFMDASGKGKSGFTYGFISDFGNFDQCIGLRVNKDMTTNGKPFTGKYCMIDIRFPLTQKPERNFLRVSMDSFLANDLHK